MRAHRAARRQAYIDFVIARVGSAALVAFLLKGSPGTEFTRVLAFFEHCEGRLAEGILDHTAVHLLLA